MSLRQPQLAEIAPRNTRIQEVSVLRRPVPDLAVPIIDTIIFCVKCFKMKFKNLFFSC